MNKSNFLLLRPFHQHLYLFTITEKFGKRITNPNYMFNNGILDIRKISFGVLIRDFV